MIQSSGFSIACPRCGNTWRNDADSCPHCGADRQRTLSTTQSLSRSGSDAHSARSRRLRSTALPSPGIPQKSDAGTASTSKRRGCSKTTMISIVAILVVIAWIAHSQRDTLDETRLVVTARSSFGPVTKSLADGGAAIPGQSHAERATSGPTPPRPASEVAVPNDKT
jgi:hypothetical protein